MEAICRRGWQPEADGRGPHRALAGEGRRQRHLLWQHLYYQVNPATGRPLGEYFASSALATDGGPMAIGYTENYTLQKGELYGVKTDGSGAVGTSCSEVNPASPLTAVNPALTAIAPSLPVQTTLTTTSKSPATTLATSVVARANC